MAVSKLASGFECEFVTQPPDIIQTECLICLLVLREPYQVICCGKSFCRSCIGRVKALNNPCPHCNTQNFTDFPNKGLQQPLYQLKVRCTHQRQGCKWTGELGVLDNHLNSNPQPNNQLKGCVYVTVECTHCSEAHQRQYINHHQNEVCLKRPFTCEHCKTFKSTFEDVTTKHWSVCGCYPIPCSNTCGAVLQRRNLDSHVAKDCPLTEIKCDFHYAGCEVRLPRKDMDKHLRVELVSHMSMLAVSHQQQIASQQQQIAMQQQLNASQQQQISSHQQQIVSHQQLNASYKQDIAQDRQRINELMKENEALKQRVTELEREQKEDRSMITAVHPELKIPPLDIIMPHFDQLKKSNDPWYSPPFSTHHRGYHLCLSCYPNGLMTGRGSHVSVYIRMMRGEFDDELKWPFCGQVTIQLLSQDGFDRHHTRTIRLNDPSFYSRVTVGERASSGQGSDSIRRFITQAECKRYIRNDSLHFRIVEVKLL